MVCYPRNHCSLELRSSTFAADAIELEWTCGDDSSQGQVLAMLWVSQNQVVCFLWNDYKKYVKSTIMIVKRRGNGTFWIYCVKMYDNYFFDMMSAVDTIPLWAYVLMFSKFWVIHLERKPYGSNIIDFMNDKKASKSPSSCAFIDDSLSSTMRSKTKWRRWQEYGFHIE